MDKSPQVQDSKKKPVFKKWWFWLIVVIVVGAIGASTQNKATKVGENSNNGSKSSEQTEFKVGDVIAYENREITVKSVERNWTAEYSKPDAGKEYIKVNLYIENKSDDKMSYNVFDWELQDGSGDIKSQAWAIGNEDNLSSGDLAKGGKKSGSVVFEIPKDDHDLTLHYKSSFWSNKTIEIKLQ